MVLWMQADQGVDRTARPVCDYEGSRWRTAFWPGREYEDRAERIALAHLLPPRGQRLCEIGAGFGRLADFYRGYERVILLDYARSMLVEARDRLGGDPRFSFVAADLYNLPLAEGALDTAVTVRVLHHVADIPRAFAEIARVVRPDGAYVLEYANKRHVKARLRHALTHRGPDPNGREPYEFVKLNFDFHPRYIEEELARVHLLTQDARAVSTLRVPFLKRIVPPGLLASLDGALQHPTAAWQLAPSMFLCARAEKSGEPKLNEALWRCPACGSIEMEETLEALTCRACGKGYPVVEGIIEMKVG